MQEPGCGRGAAERSGLGAPADSQSEGGPGRGRPGWRRRGTQRVASQARCSRTGDSTASRVGDAAFAAERRERLCGGRRRRAGTRPAPRPDAQFGSCLGREGGSAARAVGKCSPGSLDVAGGVAYAALGIVGVAVPCRTAGTLSGLDRTLSPRGLCGGCRVRRRCFQESRVPERGSCGGSRRLGGGGGAARAAALASARAGAGIAWRGGSRRAGAATPPLSPLGPGVRPLWGGEGPRGSGGSGDEVLTSLRAERACFRGRGFSACDSRPPCPRQPSGQTGWTVCRSRGESPPELGAAPSSPSRRSLPFTFCLLFARPRAARARSALLPGPRAEGAVRSPPFPPTEPLTVNRERPAWDSDCSAESLQRDSERVDECRDEVSKREAWCL